MKQLKRLLVIALSICLMVPSNIVAFADVETSENGMIISGEISESITVEEDVDKVVLSGVNAADDVELILNGDVVIEIEDGTDNKLGYIEAYGAIEFVGDGNLELDKGIFADGGDMVFNHTGNITVNAGTIVLFTGDIVFNSGEIDITTTKDYSTGVVALEGNIEVNDGVIAVSGDGASLFAWYHVIINGGDLSAIDEDTIISFADKVEEEEESEETEESAAEYAEESEEYQFFEDFEDSEDSLCFASAEESESYEVAEESSEEDIKGATDDLITGEYKFLAYEDPTYVTDVFRYRDSYFANDSTKYNQQLAVMSMNLAASAFSSYYNSTYNYDNVKDMFGKIGFGDFSAGGYSSSSDNDNIAYAFANKKIKVNGVDRSVIAVAVRGSGYSYEWCGNVDVGQTGEHAGFAKARNKVVTELLKYIENNKSKLTQNPKIWLVGFSRGAATVNLATNFLDCAIEANGDTSKASSIVPSAVPSDRRSTEVSLMTSAITSLKNLGVQFNDIYSYCFEAPQGKETSGSYKNFTDPANNWVVNNQEDIVPHLVPTSSWNFGTYGVSVDPRTMTFSDGKSHEIIGSIYNKGTENKTAMKDNLGQLSSAMLYEYNKANEFEVRELGIELSLTGIVKYFLSSNDDLTAKSNKNRINAKNQADYMDKLAAGIVEKAGSRSNYIDKYQAAVSYLMFMYQKYGFDLIDKAKDVASDEFNNLNLLQKYELIDPIIDAEINSDGTNTRLRNTAKSKLTSFVNTCITSMKNKGYITTDEATKLTGYSEVTVSLLYDFVMDDYQDNNMELTATGLYLEKALINGHVPEVELSYLRTHDPEYMGSSVPETFTVSIQSNNSSYGTVSDNSVIVAKGTAVTTKDNTLKFGSDTTITATPKSGYKFDSWSNVPSTVTGNATITANFSVKPVTYTVSFNKNGGSGTANQITVTQGSKYGTLPSGLTKTGYEFAGWWTSSIGGSQVTSDTVVNLTGNQTLYAHWTQLFTVTITAGQNGSVSRSTIENVPSGTQITKSNNVITINGISVTATADSGYKFSSWSSQTQVTGNITITASFESSGGGSGSGGGGGGSGSGGGGGGSSGGGSGSGGGGSKTAGQPGQASGTFSSYWVQDVYGTWRIFNRQNQMITSAWLCDDAVMANGQNVWYLIQADGTMLAAGFVQDNTGNFYSLETNHNGYFGMLRYVDGWYNCNGQQVYLQFSHAHDGTFGAVINADGRAKLQAIYGLSRFYIGNERCVYTSTF